MSILNKIFKKSNLPTVCPLQLEFAQNDIEGNTQRIIDCIKTIDADLFVCPTLALNGGTVDVSALSSDYPEQIAQACREIAQVAQAADKAVIVSYAEIDGKHWRAAATWLQDGGFRHIIHSLSVEQTLGVLEYKGSQVLVTLDELDENIRKIINPEHNPFDLILVVQAKKFHFEKLQSTQYMFQTRAAAEKGEVNEDVFPIHAGLKLSHENHTYYYIEQFKAYRDMARALQADIVMVNMVGASDVEVFSGASCAFNKQGELVYLAPSFTATDFTAHKKMQKVDWKKPAFAVIEDAQHPRYTFPDEQDWYDALVTSLRCYVKKQAFEGVLLELSDNLDSVLNLAMSVEALGKDKVQTVYFTHSGTPSENEAVKKQAASFGVGLDIIPLHGIMDAYASCADSLFSETRQNNQQATKDEALLLRCKSAILMSISENKNWLLLCTKNKSDLAMGDCVLYGDMAGGFMPLKDVLKTNVYELAKYLNLLAQHHNQPYPIPEELTADSPASRFMLTAPKVSVPPYVEVDTILTFFLVYSYNRSTFIESGHNAELVDRVFKQFYESSTKRLQAAPGPCISYYPL